MTTTIEWRCAEKDQPTERRIVLITDGERVAKAEWTAGQWPNQQPIAGPAKWDGRRLSRWVRPTHWAPVEELLSHDDS